MDDLPGITPPEFCGKDSWSAGGALAPNQNLSVSERESLRVKLQLRGRKTRMDRGGQTRQTGGSEWVTTGLYRGWYKPQVKREDRCSRMRAHERWDEQVCRKRSRKPGNRMSLMEHMPPVRGHYSPHIPRLISKKQEISRIRGEATCEEQFYRNKESETSTARILSPLHLMSSLSKSLWNNSLPESSSYPISPSHQVPRKCTSLNIRSRRGFTWETALTINAVLCCRHTRRFLATQ